MFSTSTSENEEALNTDIIPEEIKNEQYLPNPIQFSSIAEDFLEYSIKAKSFIATCNQVMEDRVLDSARDLINEATGCRDVCLEPGPEPPAPNPKDEEQWHHHYSISFQVLAKADPKDYLNDFFSKNILQLQDAAVRIAYFETSVKRD